MSFRRKTEISTKPKTSRANGTFAQPSSRTRNPRRQSSQRAQKVEKPQRTNPRLRKRFPNTLSSLVPLQEPSYEHERQASSSQRERLRDSEEEAPLPVEEARPIKRARINTLSVSDTSLPLTNKNLGQHLRREGPVRTEELLEGYLDQQTLMSTDSNKGGRRGSKRTVSIRSDNGSVVSASEGYQETASQTTQKSSSTAANYRHNILKGANIRFQFRPAPEDICNQISAIVQREVSAKRRKELSPIAQKLHDSFVDVLSRAAREDDCIEPFYQALAAMGYSDDLTLPRKADWQTVLKPRIRPMMANFDHLFPTENEAEDSPERPSKRQQGDESYPSPNTSGAAATGDMASKDKVIPLQDRGSERMGRPPTLQLEVKTPRPDISIGLKDAAVDDALQSRGLTEDEAEDLLKGLAIPDARNGGRPLLCSEPTQAALEIRFPFLVVEGKSYATGRTIYEAQNQAAVSGACSLNVLHDLDDLASKANPRSYIKVQPIIFSICTEGPIHQLWAHYTTSVCGRRMYYSVVLKTCDMAVCSEIQGFLQWVDNVISWGSSDHKERMAGQLIMVRGDSAAS